MLRFSNWHSELSEFEDERGGKVDGCSMNKPHVSQSGPPLPLLCPLNNLDTINIRTIDLDPHLASNFCQFISQQECCIYTPRSNVQTYSRERIARLKSDPQDVPDLDALSVLRIKKSSPFTSWVEDGKLSSSEGSNRVFHHRARSRRRREDLQCFRSCSEVSNNLDRKLAFFNGEKKLD
jgi:hypothetical protein